MLRERHWRIYSISGTLETVKGRGVIGQEPVFSPAQPAFQYSSHVSLQSPSGHMWWAVCVCVCSRGGGVCVCSRGGGGVCVCVCVCSRGGGGGGGVCV